MSTAPGHLRESPTRTAQTTVLAAATLTIMAAAIIAPSLPAMTNAHAATPGAEVLVRLALTITSLAIAVSAPAAGLAADRLGRRPVLVGCLILYAAAGTAALYVNDLWALLGTRAMLGVAVGGIMTAIGALIADWFDGPRRARLLGLQQACASIGGVVFLPIAGVLAELDYRAPSWIYAVAVVIVPFAVLAVREPRRPVEAETVRTNRRRIPVGVVPVYVIALAATTMFFLAPTQLPFLLRGLGVGPAATGAVLAGSTLTGAVGALVFPALHRRVGGAALTIASIALLGAGWLVIGTANSTVLVVVGLLLGGAGAGLTVPTLNLRVTELAPPELRGRALSGLVAGVFLGQFLSPLVAQPLIAVSDIAGAFVWTGIASLAAAVAAGPLLRSTNQGKDRIR